MTSNNVVRLPKAKATAPKQRLSDALLRSLKADGQEHYYPDPEVRGLRLRLTPGGARIWQLQFKPAGAKAPRKVKIGTYPETGLAAARKAARQLRAQIDAGSDPAAQRQAEKAQREAADERSLHRLVALFETQHVARLRPATREIYTLALRRYIEPAWKELTVDQIDRAAVHALLDPLRNEGRDSMARSVLTVAHQLLALAVDRGWRPDNPANAVRRPAPPKARQRILSDDEIRWLWTATANMPAYGPAFRLLLLTAARRSEISGMAWDELDLDQATWTIRADRCKNGKAHVVDLSNLALAELDRIPRGDSPLVFARRTAPLGNWAPAKAELDTAMARLAREEGQPEPDEWRTHDLRRSAASLMARLRVDAQTVEAVLNHKGAASSSLMQVYQVHDRRPERREAIQLLGDHIATLVGKT